MRRDGIRIVTVSSRINRKFGMALNLPEEAIKYFTLFC